MSPLEQIVQRINAANQRIRIEEIEIAEARRNLDALVRERGIPIPPTLLDSVLLETRHVVDQVLRNRTAAPYTGQT